jgi:Ran GTPase-activating protein (RanGAP) involved in mRNA processing and transport
VAQALQTNTVRYVFFFSVMYTSLCYLIQTLTVLSLKDNKISAEGVQYLAEALEQNTVKKNFFISFTQ